ncbi:GDSL-type esterase/lipase family protein [Mucilaginibacter sp. SMC90]|uniref:GDSL-type esterase/lipase family protein n=1 Tax=Mucilaginibacter sp. SMC90 TaxID=2929803 RepID=UPI001FB2B2CB|nr:GDSL-type esterase/lipase family protein [Mucilaginibacter sp. SMC90]UOE51387.1 GDSL-type esterase/lipase family protein [Mucilaginibacter sp. SMC90]
MKKGFILSIILNVICLPLATIYVIRKVQFYQDIFSKSAPLQNENLFWKIRNSEFKTLEIDSNSIVFIGDSHTQNFEVAEYFNNIDLKNRGVILDGAASVLERLDYIVNKHPKKIFIQIGINDLLSGVQPKAIAEYINSMVGLIKKASPQTSIFIQSVFPTNWNRYKDHKPVFDDIRGLNKQLEILSHKNNSTYINLFTLLVKGNGLNPKYDCGDSLHLNGQGYQVWRDAIKPFINN